MYLMEDFKKKNIDQAKLKIFHKTAIFSFTQYKIIPPKTSLICNRKYNLKNYHYGYHIFSKSY